MLGNGGSIEDAFEYITVAFPKPSEEDALSVEIVVVAGVVEVEVDGVVGGSAIILCKSSQLLKSKYYFKITSEI